MGQVGRINTWLLENLNFYGLFKKLKQNSYLRIIQFFVVNSIETFNEIQNSFAFQIRTFTVFTSSDDAQSLRNTNVHQILEHVIRLERVLGQRGTQREMKNVLL